MKWLKKKVAEVLHKWRADEISYAEAVSELHALGWNLEYTHQYLIIH